MSTRRRSSGQQESSTPGSASRRSTRRAAASGNTPLPALSEDRQEVSDLPPISEDAGAKSTPQKSSQGPTSQGNSYSVSQRGRQISQGLPGIPESGDLPLASEGMVPGSHLHRRTSSGHTGGYRGSASPAPRRRDLGGSNWTYVRHPETPGSVLPSQDDESVPLGAGNYIWGTNLDASVVENKLKRFFNNCGRSKDVDAMDTEGDGDEHLPKYMKLIKEVVQQTQNEAPIINIDTRDIREMDMGLYMDLVKYPLEVLQICDGVIMTVIAEVLGLDVPKENPPQSRVYNLEHPKAIRDLDPNDIDCLVSVEGMVTRTSPIIPDLNVAMFQCQSCSAEKWVPCDGGKLDEPAKCPGCGQKWAMRLMHNRGIYMGKQIVKMQEKPSTVPEGETPRSVLMYCFDTNVDLAKPGDQITVTGLYRAVPMRVNPRQRSLHALYKTYIDIIHIQRDERERIFAANKDDLSTKIRPESVPGTPGTPGNSQPLSCDNPNSGMVHTSQPVPTQLDETEVIPFQLGNLTRSARMAKEHSLMDLSAQPDLYERLVRSVAPKVWHMEDVKKGLLCQLFGGCTKVFPGGKCRGEINILVVGDPSVSKSQLLGYVHHVAPRGIYTSGKGSSAVGLTAYVTKDPETNEMVLESGALVLSDRGICCIDEFDKMSDNARSMLHEVMEQQTVSVAKAGLISQLNARTSVLACANPVGSRYNPNLSLTENINLPPTLLSRFDLIYLVLDEHKKERDMQLARHLVSLFYQQNDRNKQNTDTIPPDVLKDYIAFAKARCSPKLSEEAQEYLVRQYKTLRHLGRQRQVVTATPRQLESLIRLSEALARMRMHGEVTQEHVAEACRLWYAAAKSSASDSQGNLDVGIYEGASFAERQLARAIVPTCQDLLVSHFQCNDDKPILVDELLQQVQASMQHMPGGKEVMRSQVLMALRELTRIAVVDERTGVVKKR